MHTRWFLSLIFGLSVSLAGQVPQGAQAPNAPVSPASKAPEELDQTPLIQPSKDTTGASHTQPRQDVVISSGDLLTISVYDAPDYRYDVRVNSSGSVTLPMVGAIHVAGMSVADAEEHIGRQMQQKGIFNQPQVSVFEKEFTTQGISVLGEVQKPGIYPLMGTRTLLDAISASGGVTPKSSNSATIRHRDQPDQPQTVKFASRPGDAPGEASRMVVLQPGDTVVVEKAGIVYVVGDVKEPAGIIMENDRITVLQAIAMAHGINNTAKVGASKLIRTTPDGPQEVPIHLKKILSAQAPDMPLQPGDVLFIPNSRAKEVGRRSLDVILSAAATAIIYRP